MKTLLTTLLTLFFTITLTAQTPQEDVEYAAIEKTVLNYIENFFENEFDQMNKSLHPRLAKRGFNQDGATLSEDVPPEKLKDLMSQKSKLTLEQQNNTVKNISRYGNMASATLLTGYPTVRWVEYIHLVKLDGDWTIINIFWEFKRKKK
ncbi:MAG: nuclear transport factor 2 family protein [Bacteroidota bacterium]